MAAELLQRARAGDGRAFGELVEPFRRELHVHCYRILGSLADAEDATQEALLAAWQGLPGFEERASVRTWLYRIATRRCLNMLRSAGRHPEVPLPTDLPIPEPTRLGEVTWLDPYPDALLGDIPDGAAGPEARVEFRAAISLAFVTALQLLPPRQRAVLILRDVLDFSAREVAGILDITEPSVTSLLKRARATLSRELPDESPRSPAPPGSAEEQELVARLTRAFEAADVDGIVALLTEDVWLRMPPVPLEYQGRELARQFFTGVAFGQGRRYRMVSTRANGQPALGVYMHDPHAEVAHAFGLFVLTIRGERVAAITRFDTRGFPHFGLPRTLPDPRR
jgi:RNA polymerase sigma-70 factor (TIGR02960 family)